MPVPSTPFTLISVTPLEPAAGPRGPVLYGVLTRTSATPDPVVELVDLVLTPAGDSAQAGRWQLSMQDELLEAPFASVPTGADVERLLLSRGYAAAPSASHDLGDLPRRWVGRSVAGQAPDEVLVTSVHRRRLTEVTLGLFASAATVGPLHRAPGPDGRLTAWEAHVTICHRSRRDGSVAAPDPTGPGAGLLRGGERSDDGPWLPATHCLRLSENTVTWDGRPAAHLDLRQSPPRRDVAERHLLLSLLRLLDIPCHGPGQALEVYRRLPRVEALFPGSTGPQARWHRRATPRHVDGGLPVLPVLVIRHEDGRLHVRAPQRGYQQAARLLLAAGLDYTVDLGEDAQRFGTVHDMALGGTDAAADLVLRTTTVLAGAPSLAVLGYEATYDTVSPGPTVRYVRAAGADGAGRAATVLRPWVHVIDYAGEAGSWVFGRADNLATARDVAWGAGIPTLDQTDQRGDLDSLCLSSPGHSARLAAALEERGFVVVEDRFIPSD